MTVNDYEDSRDAPDSCSSGEQVRGSNFNIPRGCPMSDASIDELSAYDYLLPPELIAQTPAEPRTSARMLVYELGSGRITHQRIADLPNWLTERDSIVLNDTRVVPARLFGKRKATGGNWEGLFLSAEPDGQWHLIGSTRGKLQIGESIVIGDELELVLIEKGEQGICLMQGPAGEPWPWLDRFGVVPLPPYIERQSPLPEDRTRYQTVYAETPGAIAAPTAGLHFTQELLEKIAAAKFRVTLHVGIGTFRPISVEKLAEHWMHSEWCQVSQEVASQLQSRRSNGNSGRIIAVGTTTVRTLETASQSGIIRPWSGPTELFIRPPYQFRSIDGLLTNFHLPRSSLLVMLAALVGLDELKSLYQLAIAEGYRFYSYGDAMLVL